MSPDFRKVLALALAAMLLLAAGSVSGRPRKQTLAQAPSLDIPVDASGTPIIMQGLERPRTVVRQKQKEIKREPERRVRIPRGSSGYVPPPVPSPAGGPPPPVMTQLPPPAYQPPPINSFSDRVTRCNHSFTFNAGVGNNPTGRDAYVAQCAN